MQIREGGYSLLRQKQRVVSVIIHVQQTYESIGLVLFKSGLVVKLLEGKFLVQRIEHNRLLNFTE